MKNNTLITIVTLFVFLTIYSCKKEETTIIDNSTISSKDNGAAENLFADIKKVVEEAADDEGQSGRTASESAYSFGSCATVSITPAWGDTTWPKVMEIDFGPTNCAGVYGINRRGKLIVTLTDRYRNVGSVLTVQTQNYFINDVKVEGTKTLTNNGYNLNNHLEYIVNVSNAVITYTDNTTITWNSTRTNEWIEGDSTTWFTNGIAGICDDVYLITGSANGVNRNGLAYTVGITSPLRKSVCCRWVESGTLELVPQGFATRTVDFGVAGNCDNQATVTINGNVYNISMW
ncbi:MAG: hypothetical protein JKX68_01890 [Flavobacteriales bacterium]|nr:hypothetical protein [Flavobacteriales bacterium]